MGGYKESLLRSPVLQSLRAGALERLRPMTTKPKKRLQWAYRFVLRDSQGAGTFLTDVPTVKGARAELLRIYGDRLIEVTRA